MVMDSRAPCATLCMLLLILPMCSALRLRTSLGKFGRVPSVLRGDDELNAVIALQHAHHQHLLKPTRKTIRADGSDDHDACTGLDGFRLAYCQRQRFERFLIDDYEDAQANVNVEYAPLPA